MRSGSKLKKDAFPDIFQEGTGEKGVNVNASTSKSSGLSGQDSKELTNEDIAVEPVTLSDQNEDDGNNNTDSPNNLNICTTPVRKTELTQTSPSLSASTPRKRRLQTMVKNLKRRKISMEEKGTEEFDDESFIRFCRHNFSSNMADFMIAQLKLKRRNPHGYRYSIAYKQFALTIYFLGPKVYKFLRKTFSLPHKATLCRITTKWNFSVGLNHYVFQAISVKVKTMTERAKDCILCVDEMSIKTHFFYDISLDQIIGFHKCNGNRSFEPANCALVLMARGIQNNWKQPIAYFFIHNSCNVEYLHEIIIKSVKKLTHLGLNVLGLVSDQRTNFYKFCKEMGVTVDNPYFYIDEKKNYYFRIFPISLDSTCHDY